MTIILHHFGWFRSQTAHPGIKGRSNLPAGLITGSKAIAASSLEAASRRCRIAV
ncbi:MAG: hypothetical protein IBX69_09125 [Anaerolineales bacterium]|nr:hypothetical protein [Anaerolineales bacterium]